VHGPGSHPLPAAGPSLLPVSATIQASLTWDYDYAPGQLATLYERGKQSQWDAATAVDWSAEVAYGAPVGPDSAFGRGAFGVSRLAGHGPGLWDAFRWEFQSWMVSQFLHGEQGALMVAARQVETMSGIDAKYCAVGQVVDEARHVEVFSRYAREKMPAAYPVSAPLAELLRDALADSRWDMTMLGMHIMVEALAMAAFRLADRTFHDPLIRHICRLVARDEARHVSFGVIELTGARARWTAAEQAEREDFVLHAASLMSRRFLLEDIWLRLGVDPDEGVDFARSSPLMISYRQAIFGRVVSALARIGLMTDRVRDGFGTLGLLSYAGARAAGARPGPGP
jgi:hypothetical protein